jgi:hypothetical protein
MTIRRTPAPPVSHQIVELAPGKHSSPEKGACVVELASMLAGERFSDHPRSVCPVIASFMRTLNDDLDDARRRELLPYASMIVGTRGTRMARARRARLCLSWAERLGASPGRMSRFLARWFGEQQGARVCAKAAMRHGVPVALTLVDALIVEGADAEQPVYVRQLTPPGEGTRERVAAD